jgi:hypothetical protein
MKNKISRFPALSLAIVAMLITPNASLSTLFAQGTAFTYQGRQNDGTNPANGSYDLRFAIYDAVTNGNAASSVLTNAATPVTNGLFVVTLDFGAGVFTGDTRWLDISVKTNGAGSFTALVPRQPLTPAPYAIMANSASNVLGTLPATQLSGTVPVAQLPTIVLTNNASGVTLNGSFFGNGAGITNVDLLTANTEGAISWATNGAYFVLASSPGVGTNPVAVVAADVNADGKVDLITANAATNTLSVLTNDGHGGFVLASSPVVGSTPHSLVALDINGDGKMDLAVAWGTNTLSTLTNDGHGGFALASSLSVGSGNSGLGPITTADVNGDGKPDLIATVLQPPATFTLAVLTNNGSGSFVLSSTPAVGLMPVSVVAADVNGDGKVDLISANNLGNTLSVLTNNGHGGFALASSPSVGTGPCSVVAVDVNGDGKVDLISANVVANTLSVLTNTGSGSFVLASSPAVGHSPQSVAAIDINGDGTADLLISANAWDNTLSMLTNLDGGVFGLVASPGVGIRPYSVVAADVNGDARPDLITANSGDSTLSVLFNAIQPNFTGNGQGLTYLNAITINLGGGLSGGGSAALGGTMTLTNTGVLSVTGNSDITASPTNGNVVLGTTATSANTASTIVKRDASGNFSAGSVTLAGNLNLPSTTASVGIINSGGIRLLHAYGSGSVYVGLNAGNLGTSGFDNTAVGSAALYANTSGSYNTAVGYAALNVNTNGGSNTAIGEGALGDNTIGDNNTAIGEEALTFNTSGNENTASGYEALYSNTTGTNNTANGAYALYSNTGGLLNVADGYNALYYNTTGTRNTASGSLAAHANVTGTNNTANGFAALYHCIGGSCNTADGYYALFNTTGSSNTAVGYWAGSGLTTGNFNIDIGNPGVAGESATIRIGTTNVQTAAYMAGISGVTISPSGAAVYVNSAGQLGTVNSSRRFKEAIHDMGDQSDMLLSLRPVAFRYKPDLDPQGTPQFGLIAEEVEKVAPELVLHNAQGQVYSVRYEQVNAMLLNEFLKEHKKVETQSTEIQDLKQSVADLKALVEKLAGK